MALISNIGTMITGGNKNELKGLENYRKAIAQSETPDEAKLRYQVELLRDMGQLTPEMEEAILQQSSSMETVQTDPNLRNAQMEALARLQQQSMQGLDLNEMAALQDISRQQAQTSRADQQAIMQNMAARGQLGSGAELAARLSASQGAADQAGQQGSELARLMASRKMEAAQAAGQQAGGLRSQEFGEKSQIAQARDMINQFNTQSRQGVQTRNVGSKNVANQYNLDYSKDREAQRADAVTQQGQINAQAYAEAMGARNQKLMGYADAGVGIGKAKDTRNANRIKAGQGIVDDAARAVAAFYTGGASEMARGAGGAMGGGK